ncbi:MAG: ATP-dependent RecD-like DNA helicase, partial [Opitutales bacterium]|nr:ATP-dependent RecD-like DNA helicase [Opitutales bacterium]
VDNSTQLDPDEDFQFVRAKDQPDCSAKVLEVCEHFVGRRLALDPVSESQVLAPMHRGESGVANLNTILQSRLNQRTTSIKLGGSEFKVGDKVIQNRNNYDLGVFNGDIGIIESVNLEDGSLSVDFDRRSVQYQKTDLIDLALAYAVSIHKSQGSEYPVVIIPLLKAHFMMLQRNLIYTAVTRGRKKAIIVGDPAAFAMAVRSSESKTRRTLLKERLSYT